MRAPFQILAIPYKFVDGEPLGRLTEGVQHFVYREE